MARSSAKRGQDKGSNALLDSQTGVLKAEIFEYLLGKEIERSTRYALPFSLATIALDGGPEKKNGEEKGRDNQKVLGNILRGEVRKSDILGKEKNGLFCWIMHETDEENSRKAGERLRKEVEELGFNGNCQTLSMGIVTFPAHGLKPAYLLRKARNRLSRAQAKGGNRLWTTDGGSGSRKA